MAREQVRGWSKKGRDFYAITTLMSEPILSFFMGEKHTAALFVAGQSICSHYVENRERPYYRALRAGLFRAKVSGAEPKATRAELPFFLGGAKVPRIRSTTWSECRFPMRLGTSTNLTRSRYLHAGMALLLKVHVTSMPKRGRTVLRLPACVCAQLKEDWWRALNPVRRDRAIRVVADGRAVYELTVEDTPTALCPFRPDDGSLIYGTAMGRFAQRATCKPGFFCRSLLTSAAHLPKGTSGYLR